MKGRLLMSRVGRTQMWFNAMPNKGLTPACLGRRTEGPVV